MKSNKFRHPRRRRRFAFTLVEVMIASVISSLIVGAVVSLQFVSGRAIKEIYSQTRTRSSRMRALDQIRYTLLNAQRGTTNFSLSDGNASDGYRRIEFRDPFQPSGVRSAFFFDASQNTLFYDDDVAGGDPPRDVSVGPIDVRFKLEEEASIILLRVKSQAHMKYADVEVEDGEMRIFLRNQ